jgi:hypothetical protein
LICDDGSFSWQRRSLAGGPVAVVGISRLEDEAGLDDPIDAVEDGVVHHHVGGGQLAVEVLHRPRRCRKARG